MGYTINDSDNRYNGWTNYATWRVNLEIFDGMDIADAWPIEFEDGDVYALSLQIKEYADNIICDPFADKESLAVDYARAFLSDVNWREIAEHMLENSQA